MLIESALVFLGGWLLGKEGWGWGTKEKPATPSKALWPQEGQLPAPSASAESAKVHKKVLADTAQAQANFAKVMSREPGLTEEERVRRQVLADTQQAQADFARVMSQKQ